MNQSPCCAKMASVGHAVLRIVTGFLFFQHGAQKLFNWPMAGPGQLDAFMTFGAWLELAGGLLILIGLMTRPVAFLLCGEMAVAFFKVHFSANAPLPLVNKGELAVVYCFIFFFLMFAGAGAASVDSCLCCRRCGDKASTDAAATPTGS